jgi:hypothetical protein
VVTCIYAYTLTRQLKVMERQLDEMKMDRELNNQPFILLRGFAASMKKPRIDTMMKNDDTLTCILRPTYEIFMEMKNIGNVPAVGIIASAAIYVYETEAYKRLWTKWHVVDTLLGEDSRKTGFAFGEDFNGRLVEEVLRVGGRPPVVEVKARFRNISGGCFEVKTGYRLLVKSGLSEKALKECSAEMQSFEKRYESELTELHDNQGGYYELVQKIRITAEGRLRETGDFIGFDGWAVPGYFNVGPITREEYEKGVEEAKDNIPFFKFFGDEEGGLSST